MGGSRKSSLAVAFTMSLAQAGMALALALLLALAASPVNALTPAELRAMRESAARADGWRKTMSESSTRVAAQSAWYILSHLFVCSLAYSRGAGHLLSVRSALPYCSVADAVGKSTLICAATSACDCPQDAGSAAV